jgi:hypothetical protein
LTKTKPLTTDEILGQLAQMKGESVSMNDLVPLIAAAAQAQVERKRAKEEARLDELVETLTTWTTTFDDFTNLMENFRGQGMAPADTPAWLESIGFDSSFLEELYPQAYALHEKFEQMRDQAQELRDLHVNKTRALAALPSGWEIGVVRRPTGMHDIVINGGTTKWYGETPAEAWGEAADGLEASTNEIPWR